jgi:hypothetical protein
MTLRLANSNLVGYVSVRRGAADRFYFWHFININRNAVRQRKRIEIAMFLSKAWAILPFLKVDDGLISQIFHHTKPI